MSTAHQTLVDHSSSVHAAILSLFACLRDAERAERPVPSFDDGLACALQVLRSHHAFEEELLLPKMREKRVAGPWERVTDEHDVLVAHMRALESGEAPAPHLDAICALLPHHFAKEEQATGSEVWAQIFTEDEARAFGKQVAAHHRTSLQPTAKLLPLLLYNLDEAQRERFTDRMPDFIVGVLVPVVFRPRWRHLRAFMAHAPDRWTPEPLQGLMSGRRAG
jgi:hypothetical protein